MPITNNSKRDAISSPCVGYQQYNIDLNRVEIYDGYEWIDIMLLQEIPDGFLSVWDKKEI